MLQNKENLNLPQILSRQPSVSFQAASQEEILQKLEQASDDLKAKKDEIHALKLSFKEIEKESEEKTNFLQKNVNLIEESLEKQQKNA